MKKFVIVTIGFSPPTPEMMKSWIDWFKSIEGRIIEQIGLFDGKEITKDGLHDLSMDLNAITGILVINADDMEEALAIAQECPMVTSTKVYEVRPQ